MLGKDSYFETKIKYNHTCVCVTIVFTQGVSSQLQFHENDIFEVAPLNLEVIEDLLSVNVIVKIPD